MKVGSPELQPIPTDHHPNPVAVLGGGPAGAAVVLALLDRRFSVIWLLNRRTPRPAFGEHLAPEATGLLAQLGLEGILDHSIHQPVSGIVSYWGGPDDYEQDYFLNPFGRGWNLDRGHFDQAMFDSAVKRGAQIVDIRRTPSVRRHGDIWTLEASTLTGRHLIDVRFLVDATGRNASLARRIGVRPARLDRLIALFASTAIYRADRVESDKRLMIEPMSNGWWYSLILQNRRLIAVYMTDSDLIPPGIRGAARFWKERLEASENTKVRVGPGAELQAFAVAPAYSQHLPHVGGDGWLTVGDACMAFDPLAARGLLKAFRDGLSAAKAIAAALCGHCDLLDAYMLDKQGAYSKYLNERCAYYQKEKRWPNNQFWKRRQRLA